jgi:glycosyltransferase involved in cell wall biosynthesis
MNSSKRAEISIGLVKKFWMYEANKVRKYEADIYPYFNSHTIISRLDASQMPEVCRPLAILPNGIDRDFFSTTSAKERDIDLLFVGNLSYYSNEDAVQYLIKNIIPYISPSIKVVIAGASPSRAIKNLVTGNPTVTLIPNVEDIKVVYRRAKIFIAPITKGTGMQNKILEAIASGCEVICSKEVSDGLGLKLNTIHVALNASAYVSEVGTLLSHFDSHTTQRENSKNYIAQQYNWQDKNKELMDIIYKDKV